MKYIFCGVLIAASALAQNFPAKEALDDAIDQAIRKDEIPGAVLLIGGLVLFLISNGVLRPVPRS